MHFEAIILHSQHDSKDILAVSIIILSFHMSGLAWTYYADIPFSNARLAELGLCQILLLSQHTLMGNEDVPEHHLLLYAETQSKVYGC